LALFYVGIVYSGFLVAADDSFVLELLTTLYIASVAATWVAIDAGSRRHFIPHSWYMIFLGFWPLTVPAYLI
jgi:hypothetical protein